MNIKITHNWLLEYLETNASPEKIQKYLSLCGPSIESITKINNSNKNNSLDYVYEIEITSNRIDAASVFGIAQEAQAILPIFGEKAKLKFNPLEEYRFKELIIPKSELSTELKVTPDLKLCSRFTAIVIKNIKISPSPDFIRQRLIACGIKSINNVVDISNYLMLALGQPVHVFDYEQINKQTMIMRESKKGEKIITLDDKEIILPGGDIIIEDGDGRLIDLCGIMGAANSAVSEKTKQVVLFVQTYKKERIRRTSMLTGQRTMAATYFEKGLDEERVESTLVYGVNLLQKYAQGKIASPLYDIYPKSYQEKELRIEHKKIEEIIGIKISEDKIKEILTNLGFKITKNFNNYFIKIPSWRTNDINLPEDIIEEIARIYGYHNLPNNLPPPAIVAQPVEFEKLFNLSQKIKYFLKHLGLNEVINYSMISKKLLENLDLDSKKCLKLANTISSEIEYLRNSLLPSLIKNIKENEGKRETLKFFEIGKIYHPKQNDLPNEIYKLGMAVNTEFFDLKGIIEALFKELKIENYQFRKLNHPFFDLNQSSEIFIENTSLGYCGTLKPVYKIKNQLKIDVFLAEIDILLLINNYKIFPLYQPLNPYAIIKLDLTIANRQSFEEIKTIAFKISKLLVKIEVIDIFKNKITLRFYFSSKERNITEEEAKKELMEIKNSLYIID